MGPPSWSQMLHPSVHIDQNFFALAPVLRASIFISTTVTVRRHSPHRDGEFNDGEADDKAMMSGQWWQACKRKRLRAILVIHSTNSCKYSKNDCHWNRWQILVYEVAVALCSRHWNVDIQFISATASVCFLLLWLHAAGPCTGAHVACLVLKFRKVNSTDALQQWKLYRGAASGLMTSPMPHIVVLNFFY